MRMWGEAEAEAQRRLFYFISSNFISFSFLFFVFYAGRLGEMETEACGEAEAEAQRRLRELESVVPSRRCEEEEVAQRRLEGEVLALRQEVGRLHAERAAAAGMTQVAA